MISAALSSAEIEIIRRALRATFEGNFFPDWEFETLIGVDRDTVRQVYEAWPQQTVDREMFICAVVNSMIWLIGYPHGLEDELAVYIPEGRAAIGKVLRHLNSLDLKRGSQNIVTLRGKDVTDTAALLTSRLAGHRMTSVEQREFDWAFAFSTDVYLSAGCPWRVLVDDGIALTNSDDGQQFGFPEPIIGEEEVRRLLVEKHIQRIAIHSDTGDLSIFFDCCIILEVLNMSCGYEGWHLSAGDTEVIALGGGKLAVISKNS
jgi:hypothetical protein